MTMHSRRESQSNDPPKNLQSSRKRVVVTSLCSRCKTRGAASQVHRERLAVVDDLRCEMAGALSLEGCRGAEPRGARRQAALRERRIVWKRQRVTSTCEHEWAPERAQPSGAPMLVVFGDRSRASPDFRPIEPQLISPRLCSFLGTSRG